MPVTYRVDRARKTVHTTLDGEVTDREVLRHASYMEGDPELDASFVELIQAQTSSMKGVTGAGMRTVAGALRRSATIRKIAIVASHDVEFGLARMVGTLADESAIEIRVFRDQAEARSWLGIE